ncbi:MAG: type II and III secretion system protein family protein [Alphaproteobacteria bacterium]|nr:type II and III secretion system protein family protein [Alphaproteobacteria bacterium]
MKRSYQPRLKIFACFAFAACLMIGALPFSPVFAAKGDFADMKPVITNKPIQITLGKAELVGVGSELADVLVADPSLIDVMAVQSDKLYIVGLKVGDTNIIALDENGDIVKRLDIHVTYDLMAIQSKVDELFPGENVKVGSIHDQIILTGTASNPDAASKISNLVGHYVGDLQDDDKTIDELISNLIETRGEQQVMLQVKIVEATRNVLRELGIQTSTNDPNELAATTIFGGTQPSSFLGGTDALSAASNIALSQDPVGAARILADTGLKGVGQLGLFLEALEKENLANILAEPNLTTVSGEQAGFLAGGEFPVPVGRDNVGNVVVEFREFGVSLNFRPIVLSENRISLQMDTEVSSLDFENAVILADLTVPGRDIRRAQTTVEMASGSSLMIAGLLQSDAVKSMSGLPGVSKAPVIGDLVSSHGFERNETELVVIVTPFLVKPYAQEKVVEDVPKQRSYPLAQAFAANIRREYNTDSDLFSMDGGFGYLLD